MKKIRFDALIDKQSIVDEGDGTIRFNGGLTLTDDSEQINGTKYDISTLDLSKFTGEVFADHDYSVTAIIGSAFGLAKQGSKVVAEGVRFAVQSSGLARFVYDMVRNGFVKNVSIGTVGPPPDDDGVYHNATLKEFSFVGLGNNENARVSELALNAIKQSKADGIDTGPLRKFLSASSIEVDETAGKGDKTPAISTNNKEDDMKFVTIKNGRDFAVTVKHKNAAGDEVETDLEPGKTVDVPEEEKDAVQNQIDSAQSPTPDVNSLVADAVNKAVEPLQKTIKDLETAFDQNAAEPMFQTGKPAQKTTRNSNVENELDAMDWRDRTAEQIKNAWDVQKNHDPEAGKKLRAINLFHLEKLKEAKLVRNVVTLGDFGNFVTSPELITEIQGERTDYSAILDVFGYRETNALQMAFLRRSGDIDMTPVALGPTDGDADANLKPISDYGATMDTEDLVELAAVTPVANSATIFLAADLLDDVAAGYRTSYERNLARGVIGALEFALEADASNSIGYTAAGIDTALEQVNQIRMQLMVATSQNRVALISESSLSTIAGLLLELGQGGALTTEVVNDGTRTRLFGRNIVPVPDDLMPALGGSAVTFAWDTDTNVTINHAVFSVNPANFKGRQNGGLRYDLSTDAAYEVDGVVRSAFQRNELVLRGSMFRGAVVTDPSRVRGVRAADVIS